MRKKMLDVMFSLLCPVLGSVGCMGGSASSGSSAGGPAEMMEGSVPGGATSPQVSGPASLTIQMVDGPIDGLKEVNVEIQAVEIIDAKGVASELGAPGKIVDLLKLQDGLSETLASAMLTPGSYQGMRLKLGSNHSVRLADGSVQSLKTPSGQSSGLKLSFDLRLSDKDNKVVLVDFDVAESVHVAGAGRNSKFLLRPVLHAVEKKASGAIRGRLTVAGSGMPIAGATVFAETRDAQGQLQIVRRVRSDAEGHYVLDLLPLEHSYVVATQPVSSGTPYTAAVSGELALSEMTGSLTWDAALGAAPAVGSLLIQVLPVASDAQGDTCKLSSGDPSHPAIVASAVTTLDGSSEQVLFENLPAGSYSAQCERRTPDADGGTSVSSSRQTAATVVSGTASSVQIVF